VAGGGRAQALGAAARSAESTFEVAQFFVVGALAACPTSQPRPMTIEELAARVGELETANEELRTQLARRGTMKQTLRCACGGTTILEFSKIYEAGDDNYRRRFGLLLQHRSWSGSEAFAPLAAFACFACGYVEWHVTSFEDIVIDGVDVVRHGPARDEQPEPGPYR
jgi:hypothetical protein